MSQALRHVYSTNQITRNHGKIPLEMCLTLNSGQSMFNALKNSGIRREVIKELNVGKAGECKLIRAMIAQYNSNNRMRAKRSERPHD